MSESSSNSSASSSEAVTYARGVRLRVLEQTRYQAGVVDGFRIRIEAHGGYLMPNAIFRYIRRPLNPDDGTKADEFDGVCSSVDLEEFGEGAPIPDAAPPFLRLDYMDVVVRSRVEAQEAVNAVVAEVGSLVDSLNAQDVLAETVDLTIGNPPPD